MANTPTLEGTSSPESLALEIARLTIWAITKREAAASGGDAKEGSQFIPIKDSGLADIMPGRPDDGFVDQRGALQKLRDDIRRRNFRTIFVGGVAGVGKSSIMRRAAFLAATEFRDSFEGTRPQDGIRPLLPIWINLENIKADPSSSDLRSHVFKYWLKFLNGVKKHWHNENESNKPFQKISETSLHNLMEYDCLGRIGFLDSFDGFSENLLGQHENLEKDLLSWVEPTHGEEDGDKRYLFSTVVFASRSSYEQPGALGRQCEKRLYISRLSPLTAKQMLPEGIWEKISRDLEKDARDLLCTPLVVMLFRSSGAQRLRDLCYQYPRMENLLSDESVGQYPSYINRGALIELCVRCYLDRTVSGQASDRKEIERLFERASEIAFILSIREEKSASMQEISSEFDKHGFSSHSLHDDLERLAERGLLIKVPRSTDDIVFKFGHEVLKEACVAFLLASAIRDRDSSKFEVIGWHTNILLHISYHLLYEIGFSFGTELLQGFFRDPKKQFVYGGLMVVLTYAPIPITDDGLKLVHDSLFPDNHDLPSPLASHVTLSALGTRVLASKETENLSFSKKYNYDKSLKPLTTYLLKWCDLVVTDERFHPLTRSVGQTLLAEGWLQEVIKEDCAAPEMEEAFRLARTSQQFVSVSDVVLVAEVFRLARGWQPGSESGLSNQTDSALKMRSLEEGYKLTIARAMVEGNALRTTTAAHYAVMAASCHVFGSGDGAHYLIDWKEALLRQSDKLTSAFARQRTRELIELACKWINRRDEMLSLLAASQLAGIVTNLVGTADKIYGLMAKKSTAAGDVATISESEIEQGDSAKSERLEKLTRNARNLSEPEKEFITTYTARIQKYFDQFLYLLKMEPTSSPGQAAAILASQINELRQKIREEILTIKSRIAAPLGDESLVIAIERLVRE